jgi:phosphoribosylformimino-5-aminoimidazole carboxamide ribonucleotide (ProFAR) isomerase
MISLLPTFDLADGAQEGRQRLHMMITRIDRSFNLSVSLIGGCQLKSAVAKQLKQKTPRIILRKLAALGLTASKTCAGDTVRSMRAGVCARAGGAQSRTKP